MLPLDTLILTRSEIVPCLRPAELSGALSKAFADYSLAR
jgi:hypothetical protein